MHRTYFRTFTTTAAMVLVSFLLIGAAFGFASRQVFVSEARESMMTNSREISRMAVAYAAEGDLRSLELRMTLSTIGASTKCRVCSPVESLSPSLTTSVRSETSRS